MAQATPIIDPNPILAAAQASAQQASTKIEASVAEQERITEDMKSITETIMSGLEAQTSAKKVINLQAQKAELEAQNSAIDTYAAAGGVEFQKELMAAYQEAGKELLVANDEFATVQEREVTGIVDYFVKANEVSDAFYKAAGAEDRRDDIGETIQGINAQQESIARAVATTKKTRNVATIQATQQEIQATGDILLSKAELEGLGRNSLNVERGMRANAQELAIKMDEYKLHNTAINQAARVREQELQEKNLNLQHTKYLADIPAAQARLALAQNQLAEATDPKRKAALQATWEKTVKDHADLIAYETTAIASVRKAQAVLQIPVESEEIVRRNLSSGSTKSKERYRDLATMGASEKPVYGHTPSTAADTFRKVGTPNTPMTPALKLLSRVNAANEARYAQPGVTRPKKQAQLNVDLDATAKQMTAQWAGNIKEGDSSNPYQAPPFAVLAEFEAVKESKLFKEVLAPAGMNEFNAKEIYKQALTGIKAKVISVEEAALGIEAIFDSAAEHNNNTTQYDTVGVDKQITYHTEIVEPPIWSAKAKGAAAGALLTAGGLATVTGVGAPVGLTLIAAGGAAGTQAEGMFEQAYPLTDNMNPVQVKQTLIKLMTDETAGLLGGIL